MNQEQTNLFAMLQRDAMAIYSPQGLKGRLESGKKLKIKMGADPSRPDLHLGHSVVLRRLKLLQEQGHEIIFVIGDFTAMIGDPSGKNKTRPPLTLEETQQNSQSYFEQVTKILDKDKTTIVYNFAWLSKMNFEEVLRLAGKYTLARIMERDDFAKRYTENTAIGLHELLYPLMQGYDSVALNADIEVGGSDQTFNLLVGRELQRDYGQIPQEVITFPLLIGLDGVEKMSKSLDNYIGISEPAAIMFEKGMKVPDTLLADYFRLTTDLPQQQWEELIKTDIRAAHFAYAREIVRLYHSAADSAVAEERYRNVAGGGVPDSMETFFLNDPPISLPELLRRTGLAPSLGEAKRLIAGGGIKINNQTVGDITFALPESDFIISRGKNQFLKVILKS